jgi:predicted Zn-dependent protease
MEQATLLYGMQKHQEAQSILEEIITHQPHNSDPYRLLAQVRKNFNEQANKHTLNTRIQIYEADKKYEQSCAQFLLANSFDEAPDQDNWIYLGLLVSVFNLLIFL